MLGLTDFANALLKYDGDNLDGFIKQWAKALGVEA